jgi:hypothetical protein
MASIKPMNIKKAGRSVLLVLALGATVGMLAYVSVGGVGLAMGGSAIGLKSGAFMTAGALLSTLVYGAYQVGRRSRNPSQFGAQCCRNERA